MNKLKCYRKEVTRFIDSYDLETFLTDLFELPSHFEILESPNDTDYTCVGNGKNVLKRDLNDIEKMIKSGAAEYYHLDEIIDYLSICGHIEPGVYVIQVSW